MSRLNQIALELRELLVDQMRPFKGERVAVFLSSGTDSMCVLHALLAAKAKPRAYSFFIEGEENRFDPVVAKKTADSIGINWTPIPLASDPTAAARKAVLGLGVKSKCDVECGWPMAEALQVVDEAVVVSGHAGDGHFGLTKKVMMHKDLFDVERDRCFENPDYAQVRTLKWFAKCCGKLLFTPWTDPRIIQLLRDLSWRELNHPRQKEIARLAFEKECTLYPPKLHSDLHAAGTGIKEMFQHITEGTRFTNPVAVYHRINSLSLPVLVGQAPSKTSDVEKPLSARPLSTSLCQLLSCDLLTYLSSFERINLLNAWPGSSKKGDLFPARLGAERAKELIPYFRGREVILLGRNVAKAFGLRDEFPLLRYRQEHCCEMAVVPHPSGVNLWWNDEENKKAAATFLKSAMESVTDKLRGGL